MFDECILEPTIEQIAYKRKKKLRQKEDMLKDLPFVVMLCILCAKILENT